MVRTGQIPDRLDREPEPDKEENYREARQGTTPGRWDRHVTVASSSRRTSSSSPSWRGRRFVSVREIESSPKTADKSTVDERGRPAASLKSLSIAGSYNSVCMSIERTEFRQLCSTARSPSFNWVAASSSVMRSV